MRTVVIMMLVLAMAGCGDGRSFGERYDDTANKIDQRASNLDAEAQDTTKNDDGPSPDSSPR